MYDELTEVDIRKMREEIDYRTRVLRPKLIEDVQTARAFGDLSENFEYKCAKQEKNRNMAMTGALALDATDKSGQFLPKPVSAKGSIDGITSMTR